MIKSRTLLFISALSALFYGGASELYYEFPISKIENLKIWFLRIAMITFFSGIIILIKEVLKENKKENKSRFQKIVSLLPVFFVILVIISFALVAIEEFILIPFWGVKLF